MKDIHIVEIDYTAKKAEYKKEDNVDLSKISPPWIVPEEGPFYGDSLRVLKGGLDLIPGTDFEAVEGVTDLTKRTGKSVFLYIEVKDHILASGGELDVIYQRVGMPIISTKTLLQMLEDMVITGKPVDWYTQITGKPLTYYPAWHSHDIQNPNELVGFGGLIELFTLFRNDQIKNSTAQLSALEKLQTDVYDHLDYIQKLKWGAIMTHIRNYQNPHGVLPSDVALGNVPNAFTATPQQDADGTRSDLYSTPAGLTRIIAETEPVSEDYLMQSELPFGYYGSGIYLPPPITGSFEGLGTDQENSAFCQEGNGWVVGLIRAYDGRVKNLYYIYNQDVLERDINRSAWLNTYVQYQHPTITAAGRAPNYIVSGSNNLVMMVGDVEAIDRNALATEYVGRFWICESNSTFDPASHQMKLVDMSDLIAVGLNSRPGQWTIATVGNWVYLIQSSDSFQDDNPNYTSFDQSNWQQRLYRMPRKDLTDPTKQTVKFTRVNVNFDNLERERRTNQPALFLARARKDANNQFTQCYSKYSPPIDAVASHRRRTFIVVPNMNNPRLAKVKVLMVNYIIRVDATGTNQTYWSDICADYEWDVESNTWTLHPEFGFATIDVPNQTTTWPSETVRLRSWGGYASNLTKTYANNCVSWIPGIGVVGLYSRSTGVPPLAIMVVQQNPYLDPVRDYESMALPVNQTDPQGRSAGWSQEFRMRSPFGVAGFPRHFSDLYATTDGTRQYPIEVFIAEDETQITRAFYRVTEGGADDNYANRASLQSAFIDKPIYGRKTNSSFGLVTGLTSETGYVNRPARKDARSRESGVFSWIRRGVYDNPGAGIEFSSTTDNNGNVVRFVPEADGSIVINLLLDYTLDAVNRRLNVRPNKAKQLRIPRSIYYDLIINALGNHVSTLLDIGVDFYFAATPGSGGDIPWSMYSITYHLKGDPENTRQIVGIFNWTVSSTGADGIRVARLGTIEYPFKYGANELRPGSANNVTAVRMFQLTNQGYWSNLYMSAGLTVRQRHVQILDVGNGGPGNMEMRYQTCFTIQTPGNAASLTIYYTRSNNVVTRAEVGWSGQNPFNEYPQIYRANAEHGWMTGIAAAVSGGAMDLMRTEDNSKYIMYGATYVEGNWSIFVNADVLTTFNGYAMNAKQTNWDLRDLTDVYKNQTFYIYCIMNGSTAFYEVTKVLRNHNAGHVLVAIIKTDDFGIVTIDRRQSFTISGFPLTRVRDMGVPVSSGAYTAQGTYRFLKRSELYDN
ncbi:tail protein [Kosakonia phage Kc263]|uniref:Virion structural protein n=1 Tax=Kosakonia phage Kc263 TaxID=2863194 RepID=A0AAE7WF79_9CAUD|nr:tail protein [Kosakonia phage Kc263]QYN79952.1 hypothetical protein [Kosakonia phage Kc263]